MDLPLGLFLVPVPSGTPFRAYKRYQEGTFFLSFNTTFVLLLIFFPSSLESSPLPFVFRDGRP